jgi:hypothetical protein
VLQQTFEVIEMNTVPVPEVEPLAIADLTAAADADAPTLKRARNRSTTGNRVMTSAVLPGHSSQHSGLAS